MDVLQTKQQKMVEEAERLARESARKQAELRRIQKERLLRRSVFETIVELSDTVSEEVLLQKLNNLDVNSWWEVVEERFLDHLCGFPLCSNKVVVKQLSLYRIDRKNKKIFERCTETQKFCCEKCFLRSAYVISQLADEPLWIRGSVYACRKFDLNPPSQQSTQKPLQQTVAAVAKQPINVEFVKDRSVVLKLSDLHIGETADSDDDKREEEDEIFSGLQSRDNEDRMWELSRQMRSCAVGSQKPSQAPKPSKNDNSNREHKLANHEESSRSGTVSLDTKKDECHDKICDFKKKPSPSIASTSQQPKEEAMLTVEEKLAKLRAKCLAIKQKRRVPKMVEAKPLDVLRFVKLAEKAFEEFEKTAKEWVGKMTISYLQKRGILDIFDDKVLTEAELLVMQFYAGDRKLPGNKRYDEADVNLPRVHKYDQVLARRDILYETLLPCWHLFERDVHVEDCARRAFPLISTFTLTADNVNLDKSEARLAVAFIFRLLAHCDVDLLDEYFPTDKCMNSAVAKYLESIDCPLTVFNRMIKNVMDQIASSSSEQDHNDDH